MATVTKTVGGFGDDGNGNPLVRFEIDYDSGTLRITALRCVNNSTEAAYGQATMVSNGRSYDMRFAPGNTYIPIPTTAAARLQLFMGSNGRVDGVEYHLMFPYP